MLPPNRPLPEEGKVAKEKLAWTHLKHTRLAFAFACWNVVSVLKLKNNKIPLGKRDSDKLMLQMNRP